MGLLIKHPGDKFEISPIKLWGSIAIFFLFTGSVFVVAEKKFSVTVRAKNIAIGTKENIVNSVANAAGVVPRNQLKIRNMDDYWCPPHDASKLPGFMKICGFLSSVQIESFKYNANLEEEDSEPSEDDEKKQFYSTGEAIKGGTIALYEKIPDSLSGKTSNGALAHLFSSTETNNDGYWRLMMRRMGPKNGEVYLVAFCEGKLADVRKIKTNQYLSSYFLNGNCSSKVKKGYKLPPPALKIADRTRFLECVTDTVAEILGFHDSGIDPFYIGYDTKPKTPAEASISEENFDIRYVSTTAAIKSTKAEQIEGIPVDKVPALFDPSLKSPVGGFIGALWSEDCKKFVEHFYIDKAGASKDILKYCQPENYDIESIRNALWHLPPNAQLPAYRTIENRSAAKTINMFPNAINRLLCFAFGCTGGQTPVQQPLHVYEAGKIGHSRDYLDTCETIEKSTSATGNTNPAEGESSLDTSRLDTSFAIGAQSALTFSDFEDQGLNDAESWVPFCITSKTWSLPEYGINIPAGTEFTCKQILSNPRLKALFGRPECTIPGHAVPVMTTTYQDDSDACSQEDEIRVNDFVIGINYEGFKPCKTQSINIFTGGTNARNSAQRADVVVGGPDGGIISMFDSPYEAEFINYVASGGYLPGGGGDNGGGDNGNGDGVSSVAGIVYDDVNKNGIKEVTEKGIANWTVFLDRNNNKLYDGGDDSMVTNVAGLYIFDGLESGTYGIGQVLQTGWLQIKPDAAASYMFSNVALGSDDDRTGYNFANAQATASLGSAYAAVQAAVQAAEVPQESIDISQLSAGAQKILRDSADYTWDIGAYTVQHCSMNEQLRESAPPPYGIPWGTIEEHPLVRVYEWSRYCVPMFEGGTLTDAQKKKCNIALTMMANIAFHADPLFRTPDDHLALNNGKGGRGSVSEQTGIFQTSYAGSRDAQMIVKPDGDYKLFEPVYGELHSIGSVNVTRDYLDTLLRAAAFEDQVDMGLLKDYETLLDIGNDVVNHLSTFPWGTQPIKTFLDRLHSPDIAGSSVIPIKYPLFDGSFTGFFPPLEVDDSSADWSFTGNGYPGAHAHMPWRDIPAGDECAVYPGVGEDPTKPAPGDPNAGENKAMRSCKVKEEDGCYIYKYDVNCDSPRSDGKCYSGSGNVKNCCDQTIIDQRPCTVRQIVQNCLKPQMDTADCGLAEENDISPSDDHSPCYIKHIENNPKCETVKNPQPGDEASCSFTRCDLERIDYGYIAPLETEYQATHTQEKVLADGLDSKSQASIDYWSKKLCDVAKMFSSPYGTHVCSKVMGMVDFACTHCNAPGATLTGVDMNAGPGGEPKMLYRTSLGPNGGSRTKPYKEIFYHCEMTMPDGSVGPNNDREILPISLTDGGEELTENEKQRYGVPPARFSAYPLQWKKKMPLTGQYGSYYWECPIQEYFECSPNEVLNKQRYFSKFGSVTTQAESHLDKPVDPQVLEVYAKVEKETKVACEIIAGIHFAEGDNSPVKSLLDGHAIGEDELLSDAREAIGHFISMNGGVPGTFEELIQSLSNYNGGGNSQCGNQTTENGTPLTYYNKCPPAYPYMDDMYVTNLLSPEYTNMSIIYPMDGIRADAFCLMCKNNDPATVDYPTLCGRCEANNWKPPIPYDKPGAYTAALYFYLTGFLMGGN